MSLSEELNNLNVKNDLLINNDAREETNDDVVDPWNVVSQSERGVDYDKLISKNHPLFLKIIFNLSLLNETFLF